MGSTICSGKEDNLNMKRRCSLLLILIGCLLMVLLIFGQLSFYLLGISTTSILNIKEEHSKRDQIIELRNRVTGALDFIRVFANDHRKRHIFRWDKMGLNDVHILQNLKIGLEDIIDLYGMMQ